ncbi:hypothetical protein [Bacillus atrophaeus]|uniref:hypothetical protein n=1 Tax=Bacillus atrophaeus TaxID=1452 RepID=UPI00227F2DF5|nr:hypothetical protein [Bacillus atrophaeus]MCY8944341.1 hypothetical protein [Bacillus atrophaeus]MCY9159427.1 hypothetical protein [Bacillus atrophaeus]MED4812514.1 hypothetical protein [Bacillus atrophaeus]MED4859337.1 hypothetical protein [Bacillus atrophaeus]
MNLYRLVNHEVNADSVASAYVNVIDSILEAMSDDYSDLKKALSDIDKRVSEVYHQIEKSSFNVVQGYHLAKELKDVLQKRRVIKGEYIKLASFQSMMILGVNSARNRYDQKAEKVQELRDSLNTLIGLSDVAEDIWK